MKAHKANIPKSMPIGSRVETCDNSGAKVIKIFTAVGAKTVKGRYPAVGIGDLFMASVKKGRPDMRKQVVFGTLVRQRKEYRRPDGTRVKFEENAAVVFKDEKGNPKGTIFKGPIAKEAADRWPGVSKLAKIIV